MRARQILPYLRLYGILLCHSGGYRAFIFWLALAGDSRSPVPFFFLTGFPGQARSNFIQQETCD
jgi:hypothetical protein